MLPFTLVFFYFFDSIQIFLHKDPRFLRLSPGLVVILQLQNKGILFLIPFSTFLLVPDLREGTVLTADLGDWVRLVRGGGALWGFLQPPNSPTVAAEWRTPACAGRKPHITGTVSPWVSVWIPSINNVPQKGRFEFWWSLVHVCLWWITLCSALRPCGEDGGRCSTFISLGVSSTIYWWDHVCPFDSPWQLCGVNRVHFWTPCPVYLYADNLC